MLGLIQHYPLALVVTSTRTALAEAEQASLSYLGQTWPAGGGWGWFPQFSYECCPPGWSCCLPRNSSLSDCGVGGTKTLFVMGLVGKLPPLLLGPRGGQELVE